jgi:hypothetical protein
MIKHFFIADCLKRNIDNVENLRLFAEQVFDLLGYSINGFSIGFDTEKGNLYKSYQYTPKKKVYFDTFNLDTLIMAQFDYYPKCGQLSSDAQCYLSVSKNNDGYHSVKGAFLPKVQDCLSASDCKKLRKTLETCFDISYFSMDEMENEKRPEQFIQGMVSHDRRDELESTVAHSIQRSHHLHHKLPFLFAYNYFRSENTITALEQYRLNETSAICYELFFSDNIGKTFPQYYDNRIWHDTFTLLSDLGVLKLGR